MMKFFLGILVGFVVGTATMYFLINKSMTNEYHNLTQQAISTLSESFGLASEGSGSVGGVDEMTTIDKQITVSVQQKKEEMELLLQQKQKELEYTLKDMITRYLTTAIKENIMGK